MMMALLVRLVIALALAAAVVFDDSRHAHTLLQEIADAIESRPYGFLLATATLLPVADHALSTVIHLIRAILDLLAFWNNKGLEDPKKVTRTHKAIAPQGTSAAPTIAARSNRPMKQ
jgi:hypothetical protein